MTVFAQAQRATSVTRLLLTTALPLLISAPVMAQTTPAQGSDQPRDAAQPVANAPAITPAEGIDQSRAPARMKPGSQGSGTADRGLPVALAPMNLAHALDLIAAREGVVIVYDPATARARKSGAVEAHSAAQAIQQAVNATGLSMSASERGFIVGDVNATQPGDIVVVAHRNEAETGYGVQSVSSATRDGKNLREQPQSTSIVTARVLADEQVQTITEALRNVSGTTVTGAIQGTPSYTVRGFTATATSGGLTNPLGNSEPVANVERIEVLKGPAAILNGSANLGGIVNIVSKHPTVDTLLNISAEYATFEERKFTIDGSTALDPDRKFSARLVGQYDRASRSDGGYDGRFENLIAPSIRYKTATTDITLGGEYSDRRDPAPRFSAFVTPTAALVDFPRSYGPDGAGFRTETRRAWYEANQVVTPWLTLVSRGQHTDADQTLRINAPLAVRPAIAIFGGADNQNRTRTDAIDNYARFRVATGPIKQTIIVGANFSRYRSDEYDPTTDRGIAFQANYLSSDDQIAGFGNYVIRTSRTEQLQDGYYAQDSVDIMEKLHLVAGVRRSGYTSRIAVFSGPQAGTPATNDRETKTTANFGGVLDVAKAISVYANYISGFTPTFRSDGGPPLPPQTSKNLEGGVKIDLFAGRLAFVGSVFRLRQYNVSVPTTFDPVTNQNTYQILQGQETRGVEADLRGTILPGWQILATGTLTDTKLLVAQPFVKQIPGLPKRRASLFTTYELRGGILKGLGLGAGIYYNSSSFASFTNNAFVVPEATQVDLNGYYTIGKFRLNVGVSNLLDDKLYTTSTNTTYIIRKPGRMIRGTLTYSFF